LEETRTEFCFFKRLILALDPHCCWRNRREAAAAPTNNGQIGQQQVSLLLARIDAKHLFNQEEWELLAQMIGLKVSCFSPK
jgi:hypothetical protein